MTTQNADAKTAGEIAAGLYEQMNVHPPDLAIAALSAVLGRMLGETGQPARVSIVANSLAKIARFWAAQTMQKNN